MPSTTIASIRATPVTVPLEAPLLHSNGAHWGRFVRTIVEVETADGFLGLGEMGGGGEDATRAFAGLESYLRGHDVFALEAMRFKVCNPDRQPVQQPHAAARGHRVRVPRHHRQEARRAGPCVAGRQAARRRRLRELPVLPLRQSGNGEGRGAHARAAGRQRRRAQGDAWLHVAQAERRRVSARARTRVLPRARRIAAGRAVPLRPQFRAVACRCDRVRQRHPRHPQRLFRGSRLGHAAIAAAEGVRAAAHRHQHGRRQLRAAGVEHSVGRRRRHPARHHVLGRHPAVHQGGRRLRDDGSGRRRPQFRRTRHPARDHAAHGRGRAEPGLRRRCALPSPDRRRDRGRADALRERRDTRARCAGAGRVAGPRQDAPVSRAVSRAGRLSLRPRSGAPRLVCARAEFELGRPVMSRSSRS